MMRADQGNTQGFLGLLRQLRRSWRDKIIHFWVDGAPWHKGPLVQKYLAEHRDVHLEYLPPYQPRLNPHERIWHQVRYERTNNRCFPDWRKRGKPSATPLGGGPSMKSSHYVT